MRWNAYTNTHGHRYGYCDRYSYGDRYSYCHRYTDRNRGATSYSDTETSPDAGSAIVARSCNRGNASEALAFPAFRWMHFLDCGECFGNLPKPAMRITKQYESSLGTDFDFDHPSRRHE